jgi:hypothetical protein
MHRGLRLVLGHHYLQGTGLQEVDQVSVDTGVGCSTIQDFATGFVAWPGPRPGLSVRRANGQLLPASGPLKNFLVLDHLQTVTFNVLATAPGGMPKRPFEA